ncbi:uncharacterized protein LOC131929465 [Physella acuta]|uniref:uncharacterized protein LOC131929465 n=1 Tax=Physella acuta TaxID=109671 RepID=UPI0027DDAEE4|nr:uncharacterized protein LOC131929465 [Physella acuta]
MKVLLLLGLGLCFLVYIQPQTHGGADVIFVVDSTDRVGAVNFEKIRNWIKTVVQNWQIGLNDFRVSVISYGDGVTVENFLKDSVDVQQVVQAIDNMKYYSLPGDATEALRKAYLEGFLPANGGRNGEREVIIHVGAGAGSDPATYANVVKNVTGRGIVLYNVAIGTGWLQSSLGQYASQPSIRYSIPVANYDLLNSALTYTVATRVENEVPRTDGGLPQVNRSCLSTADIVICLDGSSSVSAPNFQIAKENVKNLISRLPLSQDMVHVGLVQFSAKPVLEFPLNRYFDRLTALSAVDHVTYLKGNTETGLAINYIRTDVFGPLMGARAGVPKIIILLTDGQATHHDDAVNAANQARQNGIAIITVGIGSQIDQSELEQISGNRDYVFRATDFEGLTHLIEPILNTTCIVQETMVTPTPIITHFNETCVDNYPNCVVYKNKDGGCDFCSQFPEIAKDACARSCGLCNALLPTSLVTYPTCKDKLNNCTSYETNDCKEFSPFFTENCALMCGYCDLNGLFSGLQNKCMYKSKLYNQGEKWQDGCEYECVCTDAQHGKFECTSQCDLYHHVPPYCTLIHREGECCLEPVCHFESTTNTFTVTSPGVNADGQSVCEYNGRQYLQNQFIDNGCTSQCTCIDAIKGTISCMDTCPTYNVSSLPSFCHLEKEPGSCCQEPKCELQTSTAIIHGFGTVSDHAGYKQIYDGSGNPVAGPNDHCIQNGNPYVEGNTWQPDCEHVCTCDTQYYGYYRCSSKCPTYDTIPAGCRIENVPNDCCPHIVCANGTVLLPSTLELGKPVAGTNVYVYTNNGLVPLLPVISPDGSIFTGSSAYSAVSVSGCLFNGKILARGEVGKDSNCGMTCLCLDETSGQMSCLDRCATYAPDNKFCTIVTDPFDACCKVPSCPLSVHNPPIGSFPQPHIVYSVVKTPDLKELFGLHTTPRPTVADLHTSPLSMSTFDPSHSVKPQSANDLPTMPPGKVVDPNATGHCVHIESGKSYREGERWTVGCQYNCLCVDASLGQYICTDMCKKFICPDGFTCSSYTDPQFPCCNLMEINLPTQDPLVPTVVPTSLVSGRTCHYNGKDYHEGEVWQEGCDKRCHCQALNATFMSVACQDLCPTYINLPPGCTEVRTPGECCPTLVGDTCSGQYCLDPQGNPHLPGSSWREGCSYECTCLQRADGFYRECRGICPVFQNLDQYICTFPTPAPGKCCALPQCCADADCHIKVQFQIDDQYKDEF